MKIRKKNLVILLSTNGGKMLQDITVQDKFLLQIKDITPRKNKKNFSPIIQYFSLRSQTVIKIATLATI